MNFTSGTTQLPGGSHSSSISKVSLSCTILTPGATYICKKPSKGMMFSNLLIVNLYVAGTLSYIFLPTTRSNEQYSEALVYQGLVTA